MPDDIANYYAEKDERWVIPVESWETYLARRDASQSENGARNEPPNTSSHTNRDHNGHGSCFRGVRGVDKAGQAGFWLGRYFIASSIHHLDPPLPNTLLRRKSICALTLVRRWHRQPSVLRGSSLLETPRKKVLDGYNVRLRRCCARASVLVSPRSIFFPTHPFSVYYM
ncbi:hypothetical protein OF83DRAFT_898399 [Amylostereum chailletii]|nr:hypothetical protein OF83DRAFT_898399 [Amylostereum chailletii]